ncbi:MAG: aminotransferase class V-fold PLP-dependent enzyme [Pirellulaceae bacterium]
MDIAHAAGAEVYLDAVHHAPHDLIDVKAWDADYCVCSAYKFFGPHVGLLWGRRARLEELVPYKLRPAPSLPPGKWMAGTQNFAAIAGTKAAIDYIASIGAQDASGGDRRSHLRAAFAAIKEYEMILARQLLDGLQQMDGITLYGIPAADPSQRVPTFAVNLRGLTSQQAAEQLAAKGIYAWGGDYYAVDVCEALGQQPDGMLRLGILHTNSAGDIANALDAIASELAAPVT